MTLFNQIYGKLKRILKSPTELNEVFIVLEKEKPIADFLIRILEENFKDQDVIITITKMDGNKWEDLSIFQKIIEKELTVAIVLNIITMKS